MSAKFSISVKTSPAKLCATSGSRYQAMSDAQLQKGSDDTDYLVATNGKAICWVPVGAGRTGKSVDWDAVPVAFLGYGGLPVDHKALPTKKGDRTITGEMLDKPSVRWGYSGCTYGEIHPERFPKTDDILPTWKGDRTLTLDAQLLLDLAKGITETGKDLFVTLDLSDLEDRTGVPVLGRAGFGVIMPVSDDVGEPGTIATTVTDLKGGAE